MSTYFRLGARRRVGRALLGLKETFIIKTTLNSTTSRKMLLPGSAVL